MFNKLRQMIFDSASFEPEETMWARIPSYYAGDSFIRLIPFKDHINIEANKITGHIEELTDYKITPRGMLQIYINQEVPQDILIQIFSETLGY